MKLSLRGRRGVASVIGTMLFVIVLMAGLGAVAYVYSLQAQSSQAAQQAQQLVNQHGKESLTYQTLSGGTLAVTNTGSSASTIKYVILKFANGTVYQLAPSQGISSGGQLSVPSLIPSQNCGLSTCLAKYKLILSSTTPGNNVGLVTALGNTFWVNPTTLQAGSSGTTTYQVTFAATGDGSFGSNPVVTVDGTNYVASQLPITLTWTAGTLHSYSYQTYTPSSGTLIGPTSVSGLSTCSTTCLISAASAGTVTAAYTTQYSLTISRGGGVTESPAPNSDGYYNAGTSVEVATNYVWNQVNEQSRQNLVSYSVDGGTSAQVPRVDSGIYTISIAMGTYHTVAVGSVTQYYLTLETPTVTSQLPPPAISYSVNNALTNPSFGTGTTRGWSAFYECLYCNGGVGIGSVVTSPVYTGDSYSGQSSYSYWTTGTIKYGLHYYER